MLSVDNEWLHFISNQNTLSNQSDSKNQQHINNPLLEFQSNDKNINNDKNETPNTTCTNLTDIIDVNIPKCDELYISTKTKVLFLNQPIDINQIFWEIPVLEYWKPESGVVKKQMKIVSKTLEEFEEYQKRISTIPYYNENIIKQINNPAARRIKFKDERKITVGLSKKDIMNCRGKVKNAFYNCFAVILRLKYDGVFREIHVKIFNTGKMEIPGIVHEGLLQQVKIMVLDILQKHSTQTHSTTSSEFKRFPTTTVSGNLHMADRTVIDDAIEGGGQQLSSETLTNDSNTDIIDFIENEQEDSVLINSNFNCGFYINRDKLHSILRSAKYGIESAYDPCSYPGVKCKFYFNHDFKYDIVRQNGKIIDEDKIMKMSELNENKKYTEVSFMIFRTGSCLIVGNCSEQILQFIFNFIKNLLVSEYSNIATHNEEAIIKSKKTKLRKKTICMTQSYFNEYCS